VPTDKHLIVTDVQTTTTAGMSVDLVEGSTAGPEVKRLFVFNSPPHAPYSSSVGLAFDPGSTVEFANVSGAGGTVSYSLTGRLSAR
jgi:hypothetical protein